MDFQKARLVLWGVLIAMMVLAWGAIAHAQLADLDLLEDDDRSVGISVSAAPDPSTGNFTEARSGILLVPLRVEALKFEGGFGTYFAQSIVGTESSSSLQWRVQGGPQFGYVGLQFYVEGFYKQGIDYAGFFRVGEFDLGRVLLSGGFGTLVRADTQAELGSPGIERNAAGGGDTKVKGLLLASAEFDTELFESCRILGTVLPGFDGEHDFVVEPQLTYSLGDINIAGLARFGWERGADDATVYWAYPSTILKSLQVQSLQVQSCKRLWVHHTPLHNFTDFSTLCNFTGVFICFGE